MNPKHHNPQRPRQKDSQEYGARAPYNFVPLPERIVVAPEGLNQDHYYSEGLTGWIDCRLETCSPVYVRGMLTEARIQAYQRAVAEIPEDWPKEKKQKRLQELDVKLKDDSALFFATTEAEVEGQLLPVIPGSSLRGMARMLVEIVGHGRMRWVADQPPFTFRAVAAQRDDPLREPYQAALGKYGRHVQAGYVVKRGDDWYVQPALTPNRIGLLERGAYLKVKERNIRNLPGYRRFNHHEYRPQIHKVSFDAEMRQGQRGRYVAISQLGTPEAGYSHQGTLVCSGNMLETSTAEQESPRKNQALVLAPDDQARLLRIRPQAIKDYLAGLTPFQKEALQAWGGEWGCLARGKPIFYVADGEEVVYFGHSPHFRVPARLNGTNRAATPQDFVPDALRRSPEPDLADAIFGWVEERDEHGHIVGPKGQRAGRVFFEDAHFESATDGVWLVPVPLAPHVLAEPRPTTFQHYLVQDAEKGHHPDDKPSLAHYGTSPNETQIRGYKLYWHKGKNPDIQATDDEKQHESQLTRMIPLKAGVRFRFNIYFENLRGEELGALLWALSLPGQPGKVYRHKLGMGKPLGMGAVEIRPRLYLSQRIPTGDGDNPSRYEKLFADDRWHSATTTAGPESYLQQFNTFMIEENKLGKAGESLADLDRIQMLLTMLEWHDGDSAWLERTRYMEIEREVAKSVKVNEYKERPVLPDPLEVVKGKLRAGREVQHRPPESRQRPQHQQPSAGRAQISTRLTPPSPQSTLEVGATIHGRVYEIDPETGDVWFEIEGIPADELMGHIAAANLEGRKYTQGNWVKCIVLAIGKSSVECRARPKK